MSKSPPELVDLPNDIIGSIMKHLDLCQRAPFLATCKKIRAFNANPIFIENVIKLQSHGKEIAEISRSRSRTKYVEIYNMTDSLPPVLFLYTPIGIVKHIERAFTNNKKFRVKVITDKKDLTDPAKKGGISRPNGFYGCVFEFHNALEYSLSYYHYHSSHMYNIDFLENPHKSYIEILDILKTPVVDHIQTQNSRRLKYRNNS